MDTNSAITSASSLEGLALAGRATPGPRRQAVALWDLAIYTLIAIGIVLVAYYQLHAIVPRVLAAAESRRGIRLLAYAGILWTVMGFVLIVVRTILWVVYRPAAAARPEQAPSLSVIIPAYNEGAMVLQSIESVINADYPRERL